MDEALDEATPGKGGKVETIVMPPTVEIQTVTP